MNHPPYKTKSVEKIALLPYRERLKKIRRAGYNLFFLNSEDVYIDFLTDSGTGAMSEDQWAALMQGDESYAGSSSFNRMQKSVRDILGFPYVIPCHQGRGAENVFNSLLVKEGMLVPGNAHFDTTRAHIEHNLGIPIDCTIASAYNFQSRHPFKGNVDVKKLKQVLKKNPDRIAYILITATCNQIGGQPVSLENIRTVSGIAKRFRVPLFFDIARFAENAYFIKSRERKYRDWPLPKIVREMMRYADGALMSAKKDAIVNIGGFIALRGKKLFQELGPRAILMEGFLNYGGMAGRDMEALAVGLREGIEKNYLCHRIGQIQYLGKGLAKIGIPVLQPWGGHAVYIDAGQMLKHIPYYQFPGQALAIAAYIEGGIRGVEVGSLMEGRDPATHQNKKARQELLRFAVPRRVYSQEHLDYVIDIFTKIWKKRKYIRGVKFTREVPILRHFSSKFSVV
ncbi:MAG: tryptophanase [Candidatus Sungbacteria bacterium]|nr:tryptophanase [Candidatus Sungbacteria bacterium]